MWPNLKRKRQSTDVNLEITQMLNVLFLKLLKAFLTILYEVKVNISEVNEMTAISKETEAAAKKESCYQKKKKRKENVRTGKKKNYLKQKVHISAITEWAVTEENNGLLLLLTQQS